MIKNKSTSKQNKQQQQQIQQQNHTQTNNNNNNKNQLKFSNQSLYLDCSVTLTNAVVWCALGWQLTLNLVRLLYKFILKKKKEKRY